VLEEREAFVGGEAADEDEGAAAARAAKTWDDVIVDDGRCAEQQLQHGEGADLAAEVAVVAAHLGQGLVGGAKHHAEQQTLMAGTSRRSSLGSVKVTWK
jgi:hypothetical protein